MFFVFIFLVSLFSRVHVIAFPPLQVTNFVGTNHMFFLVMIKVGIIVVKRLPLPPVFQPGWTTLWGVWLGVIKKIIFRKIFQCTKLVI